VAAVPWSIAAMCMAPTARTAREGKYETVAGVVKFAVGQSGSIVFLAPIMMSLPAERYTLRAHLERDDPVEPNTFPRLLGTNIFLKRRQHNRGGVENVLIIAEGQGASLLRGANGIYSVDGPGKNLDEGINVETHLYWLQVEVQQQEPATAKPATRLLAWSSCSTLGRSG
jgi:hypothetical protein